MHLAGRISVELPMEESGETSTRSSASKESKESKELKESEPVKEMESQELAPTPAEARSSGSLHVGHATEPGAAVRELMVAGKGSAQDNYNYITT